MVNDEVVGDRWHRPEQDLWKTLKSLRLGNVARVVRTIELMRAGAIRLAQDRNEVEREIFFVLQEHVDQIGRIPDRHRG